MEFPESSGVEMDTEAQLPKRSTARYRALYFILLKESTVDTAKWVFENTIIYSCLLSSVKSNGWFCWLQLVIAFGMSVLRRFCVLHLLRHGSWVMCYCFYVLSRKSFWVTPVFTLLAGTNVLRATNNLSERIILLSTWKYHTTQFISQNVLFVKNSANLLNLCGNILLVNYIFSCSFCLIHWSVAYFVFLLIGPLSKANCSGIFSVRGCNLCMNIFDSPNSLSEHKEACSLSAPVPLVSWLLNF